MWSKIWTDECKLLRCHLESHCKLTKADGPLQYRLSSDKAHWTKISPTLNNKNLQYCINKINVPYPMASMAQKKDQQKSWSYYQVQKFRTDASNESTLEWIKYQICAHQMQDGIECTNTYGDALSMLKWICHQNEARNMRIIHEYQWCTDY